MSAPQPARRVSVQALWTRYRPLARAISREFFLPGSEKQDVEQEALIALWVAARAFNGYGDFEAFARMVIKRRLGTAVRSALGQKHKPLNEGISQVRFEGEWLDIGDVLPGGRDPADIAIDRERVARLANAISRLTDLERDALLMAVNGERYYEDKSLDNAVSRARRKLRAAA